MRYEICIEINIITINSSTHFYSNTCASCYHFPKSVHFLWWAAQDIIAEQELIKKLSTKKSRELSGKSLRVHFCV
jgi:hypothetical protein